MYGADINTLNVLNNKKIVWQEKGNKGDIWLKASVELSGNKEVLI